MDIWIIVYKLYLLIMGSSESKDDRGKVQTVDMTFLWKIDKYSKLYMAIWQKSPNFTVSGQVFYLELSKKTYAFDLRLHRDGKASASCKLRCRIGIVDKMGHEQFEKITDTTINKENDTFALLELENDSLKKLFSKLFPGDTLTICFHVRILNDGEETITFRENTNLDLESLSSDFGRCLENQSNTDVVIKAKDVSFPLHRTILSARSTVFDAMLNHDCLEKREGTVKISDIEPNILEDVIHYMYTGKIRELTANIAIQMYSTADMYNLLELKEKCRKHIISSLTIFNICDAAILADTYTEPSIKNAVIQLVSEKREEVSNQDAWKKFLHEEPVLALSILSSALIYKKT